VDETAALARIRHAVRDCGEVARLRSAYGADTAWTVTVLEGISDEPIASDAARLELFVADRFLLSRIAAPGRFETITVIPLGREV
jgi:hypothetical protein